MAPIQNFITFINCLIGSNLIAKIHKFFRKQAFVAKNIKFLCISWTK